MFIVKKLEPVIDSRGTFLKIMEDGIYPKNSEIRDEGFKPIQSFITVTDKNAIRGMHFYKPSNSDNELRLQPQIEGSSLGGGISKSFLVLSGEIFFAAIDLRINSNLFGKARTTTIRENHQVSIPRMVATGFQVLSTNATILYFLDSVHKPYEDITINPSSCGISWPRPLGAISSRDLQALTLDEYTELLR